MAQLIRNLEEQPEHETFNFPFLAGTLVMAIVLGIFSGFLLSKTKAATKIASLSGKATTSAKEDTGKAVGVADEKTFPDKTEGVLQAGGLDGEGSFHLERPGGKTQWAYLTSTTVDMTPFVGKKVRLWGKTYQGEKAGWLMEVGLIKIIQ